MRETELLELLNRTPAKVIKTLTFSNDGAGSLDLFTVTGSVIVKIIAICTVNIASAAAGNIKVGIAAETDAMIPSTLATDIDADEIWHDAAPDSEIEALAVRREYIITDGNDIVITLDAQIDTGTIVFVCEWSPIEENSMVVAA